MDPVDAFAYGYAQVTAPYGLGLTERARRACEAARRVHEASPQPAAPTLRLGQLEGIWAVIYARREAIEHLHAQALQDVLAQISGLDWTRIIDGLEQQLRLDPSVTGKQLTQLLGQQVEDLINTHLPYTDRAAWQQAMAGALVDATAEGQTAALSLVADAANVTIDWNLAAADAKAALAGSNMLSADAGTWIAKQTHGLGYQISRTLATLWDQGANRDQMETAISGILDGTDTGIAGILLDQAIGQAISYGALATYTAAGVEFVDFITAGDERVCPACGAAEDDNPYLLDAAPPPPLHPGCRCTFAPSDYVPPSLALQLIDAYDAGTYDAAA